MASATVNPPPADFEFRPAAPSAALSPADELISDGKLLPLPYLRPRDLPTDPSPTPPPPAPARWKENLPLHFKKAASLLPGPDPREGTDPPAGPRSPKIRSSKRLILLGNPMPSSGGGLHTPLLGGDHHPRQQSLGRRSPTSAPECLAEREVESPRVRPCGRVVFERSASSPAGAAAAKNSGMRRSHSAGVGVAPVLSVFGFAGMLSPAAAAPRKEAAARQRRVGRRMESERAK